MEEADAVDVEEPVLVIGVKELTKLLDRPFGGRVSVTLWCRMRREPASMTTKTERRRNLARCGLKPETTDHLREWLRT